MVSGALGGGLYKPVVIRYPLNDLDGHGQRKATSSKKTGVHEHDQVTLGKAVKTPLPRID